MVLFSSCTSVKQLAVDRDVTDILKNSEVFSNHFTGFSLFDLEENKFIASHNSTLLFTPASNTKLLTMYSVLSSFQDSIPSFLYSKEADKIIIKPLGDPTFLHSEFKDQPANDFINKHDTVEVIWPEEETNPYGSGWAWDDYIYDYQPQLSWWPIYGNVVRIKKRDSVITIHPQFFEDFVDIREQERPGELVDRELTYNKFTAYIENDTSDFERVIPFNYSKELLLKLLADTLARFITPSQRGVLTPDTLYNASVDSALIKMMKPSDNFLAEQLLILAAQKNGFQKIKPFIKYVKSVWLNDLNEMRWVDGSGLSRYNLISPVDQVRLLKKCIDEFGWERMTRILPTGGEGTLKELYLSKEPYLFAKTGTLSNNHNLSGYLVTKSGKKLAFSLMNNHYTRPTQEIKLAVEKFLIEIKDAY